MPIGNLRDTQCLALPWAVLVDRAVAGDDEALGVGLGAVKRDGAEVALVLGDVLAEEVVQGLGLLGAEVDALEVFDLHLVGSLLFHGAEDHEEIPDGEANLHAVGVGFAVIRGFVQRDLCVVGLGDGLAHGYLDAGWARC